jgi:hypothetical protein
VSYPEGVVLRRTAIVFFLLDLTGKYINAGSYLFGEIDPTAIRGIYIFWGDVQEYTSKSR